MAANYGSGCALLIFAKPPRPGKVKTRLEPALGTEKAAELYAAFLADTVAEMRRVETLGARRGLAVRVFVAWQSPPEAGDILFLGGETVPALLQRGEDLGERLNNAVGDIFDQGYSNLVVVGSDMPLLTAEAVLEAFAALADHDLVLGPCADGGYYLIGLKRWQPFLFKGIAWGTERVLAQTQAKAEASGLSLRLLEEGYDVDTPESLERLKQDILAQPKTTVSCKRTLEFLRSL